MVSYEGELLFEAKIPGRVRIKKNSRRTLRTGISISSPQFMVWEKGAGIFLAKSKLAWLKNLPIKEPCLAEYEFRFINRKNECDTSNCIEGPQDLLQKIGVIENDRLITHLVARKTFGVEDCVIVRIRRLGLKVSSA